MTDRLAPLRYLDRTLPTVDHDLALDEALLVAAEERGGGPVLRVWEARRPAVVLGASGRVLDDVDLDTCRLDGVTVHRRSSGGGTVVIGPGALNVTVVLPTDTAPGLGAVDVAQAYVLERLAGAIRRAGPPAEVLGSGDLTLAGRKFAGSAQRRLRRHFLVHASLLYAFDVARIVRYTRLPRRQPAYRAGRSHDDFLTNVPLERPALLAAVRSAWLTEGSDSPEPEIPFDLVDDLVRTRFADPAWVHRL